MSSMQRLLVTNVIFESVVHESMPQASFEVKKAIPPRLFMPLSIHNKADDL